jgi:hypothetical protein
VGVADRSALVRMADLCAPGDLGASVVGGLEVAARRAMKASASVLRS